MAAIDSTLGALEIGVAISYFLFGIFTLQVFIYFKNHPDDPPVLKVLVSAVCCLGLAQTICFSHGFYIVSIKRYGEPNILTNRDPVSSVMAGLLSGITDSVVQLFFATRVRRCFKTPYVAIFCWVLAFLRIVATGIMFAQSLIEGPKFRLFETGWHCIFIFMWVDSVIVDTTITVSLCHYLWKGRQRSISPRTIKMVDLIIAMTIPTGLVTCITAIVMLIVSLSLKDSFVWMAISLFEPHLFSNCFLASLNGRIMLRSIDAHTISFSIHPPGVHVTPSITIETFQVAQVTLPLPGQDKDGG